jgi:hypothetical protein
MVAMAARHIIAISKEGDCQCRQFCQLSCCYTAVAQQFFHKQHAIMLFILEVVRLGINLSSQV